MSYKNIQETSVDNLVNDCNIREVYDDLYYKRKNNPLNKNKYENEKKSNSLNNYDNKDKLKTKNLAEYI